jgi:hypothetical protein
MGMKMKKLTCHSSFKCFFNGGMDTKLGTVKYVNFPVHTDHEGDMGLASKLEDEEGVVKGPHYYLLRRYPLEKLEGEVYELLREKGSIPLSAIWRSFDCHLWEVCAVLRRLREKGLIEESVSTSKAYMQQTFERSEL